MKISRLFVALFFALGLSILAACGGGGDTTGAGGGGGGDDTTGAGGGGGGGSGDTVASITVTPGTLSIDKGGTATFVATAKDSAGNVVSGATFTWESSDATVATVANGVATGLAAGTTTIRARAGNVTSNAAAMTINLPIVSSAQRPACGPNGTWTSLAATVANVRVWYDSTRPADQQQAGQVVAALDGQIWPTLITALGFKEPLADTALACNGGDGRLDLYIVAGLAERGLTTSTNATGNASEVFIAIRSGLAGDTLLYTVAHELMYAVEWSYTMAAPQASYGWMRNAMANWAVEAVYPGNPVLLADAACHMNSNFLSITSQAVGACPGDTSRSRDHGAYLLYQYIGRTMGNTMVRDLLAATTTVTAAIDAIESTIPGGLRALWPKYAKALWNQAPVTEAGRAAFINWDGQSALPQLAPDHPTTVYGDLGGLVAEASTDLNASVDNVSTRFYRFSLSEVGTRSLMIHNTFYPVYKADKKVSVQALWKTEDGSWVEEDWTAKEWIGMCRDAKSQRVAELVVIVASAETGTVTVAVAAEPPTFKRNNIGCWGFSGTAKRTSREAAWSSGSIVLDSTPLFDYKPNGLEALQYNDPATGRLRVPITAPLFRRAAWALAEGYVDGSCSYSLSASGTSTSNTLGGNGFGSIVINNFAESLPSSLRLQQQALIGTVRGAYTGNVGSSLYGLDGTVTGPQPDCGSTYKSGLGMMLLSNADLATTPVIDLDGHLRGTFAESSSDSTFTWDLAPMREP